MPRGEGGVHTPISQRRTQKLEVKIRIHTPGLGSLSPWEASHRERVRARSGWRGRCASTLQGGFWDRAAGGRHCGSPQELASSLAAGGLLCVRYVFIFLNSGSATYPLCDPSQPLHLPSLRDLSGHLERTPILLTPRLGGDWMSWWGTEDYHPIDMLIAHPATTPQFLPYRTAILLILSAPRFNIRSQLI